MCGFGISRQPRGAALVIVMLVMAVLLLAGTTFLTISSTESQIALNEQGYATAFVLAEAGIQKAIASLNDPFRGPAYLAKNGETNTAFGGGTFSVNLVTPSQRIQPLDRCPNDNSKDIIAAASVPVRGGNAVVTLVVTVDQVTYPYQWAAFAAVPNQIIGWLWDPLAQTWWDRTNSELLLRDYTLMDSFDSGVGPYDPTTNSGLHGNVGANGDVEIDYNSTIAAMSRRGTTSTCPRA
ncbi:MAG: PilX N-terminal domain-containing pilus assembly protein [Candidatus Methylomirabilales bacterium]